MSYPTKILYPERVTELTLKTLSTLDVSPGDLLGYSSGWVLADADAATNIYAQYIALQGGKSNSTIKACKKCVFFDEDAPYTANTAQYLSGTAGGITETRPATDGDLIQVVGRSLDTTRCMIDLKEPVEWEMFIPANGGFDSTGEAGIGTEDTGWYGPQVDAATEVVGIVGRFPSGLISVDVAKVVYNSINASAYDTDVTIVRAYDGAANNQDTGTAITADDFDVADADNIIQYQTITAAFDAGLIAPNACFSVKLDPDGITADVQVLGLYLRGFKV
jgi:hypothetical protein